MACSADMNLATFGVHSGPVTMKWNALRTFFILLAMATWVKSGPNVTRNRRAVSDSSDYIPNNHQHPNHVGLSPPVFNLAAHADISTNATCGQNSSEVYCKLVEHVFKPQQCGVCDASSPDPDKAHPITNAIDGSNNWWQSPTLQNGRHFEWVTITLDLKQMYQVAYVIVKSAISPRPGNWILERSLDGVEFKPWQYYAVSDSECLYRYGVHPQTWKPSFQTDDEVICTSFYSKLEPFEGGEIHTSLVNDRPGSNGPSKALRDFTRARYVRLRLQRIRTLNADLMTIASWDDPTPVDPSVTRRYFYSIKDISIGGHCVCHGHADRCPTDPNTGRQRCDCQHNTCGDDCGVCCPMFNQIGWKAATLMDGAFCERCHCYGHADSCTYDSDVEQRRASIDVNGEFRGGGVCQNCQAHTSGVNCERCELGYFRPRGVPRDHPYPCRPCDCHPAGSAGHCLSDAESASSEDQEPGDCFCRDGFAGRRCTRCAHGYRNFPECQPCPCYMPGTVNQDCEGDCICKENVEGPRCEYCRRGYFGLDAENPEGCSRCFCYGVIDMCDMADLGLEQLRSLADWRVTDFGSQRQLEPTRELDGLQVANDDMLPYESYYWQAPSLFLGNRLTSYGLRIKFSISWVKARGDTGGRPTRGPDVLLQGAGRLLAFGDSTYRSSNATISVTLSERGWFHVPPDVTEIVGRRRRTGYRGEQVSRRQMMEVLGSLQKVLLRAKFHTDQIEATLHDVIFEVGVSNSLSLVRPRRVERCLCPPGYAGLSCESCEWGYRRVDSTLYKGECRLCDCNGHAPTCHPVTGECGPCEHNTVGSHCQHCAYGYYGDAVQGKPCKRCRCPLEDSSNNFSPTCTGVEDSNDYICTHCPAGYTGTHCERCSPGYYGDPATLGGSCKLCNCSGNADLSIQGICDSRTGQCLSCLGNTGGWHCERCLDGYYGDPTRQDCRPCRCNQFGSTSPMCNPSTGQCECKPRYSSRACDVCQPGYGNVGLGCIPCACDPTGSYGVDACDGVTGQCACKPGTGGVTCDGCLPSYYGFSPEGCQRCGCDSVGAQGSSCDVISGQCTCKPHVTTRTCSSCQEGYWNLSSGSGCLECRCHGVGALGQSCDQYTGHCRCKSGVGGLECDHCLPGYFGFSEAGCRECEPCLLPGRLCHADTGRCVCPPGTTGSRCQNCLPDHWGYSSTLGCKPCKCNAAGSRNLQCDLETGACTCGEGFEGDRCDRCRFGFFNFPNCRSCKCEVAGTDPNFCQGNNCQCDNKGQCPCKANVHGKKCHKCKSGTFGLQVDSPLGCIECYCFRRTSVCKQAQLVWSKLWIPHSRTLWVQYDKSVAQYDAYFFPVDTQEICFVYMAPVGSRQVTFGKGETKLNVTNNLRVIPGLGGDVQLGITGIFSTPLYWQLPETFLGDKVLSYNGYLKFSAESKGGSTLFPSSILATYPLVQLQGNYRIILEYYPPEPSPTGSYAVRLQENFWRLKNNPQTPVTRETIMVALQNIQHILIRATDSMDATVAMLKDVSLDVAIPATTLTSGIAKGIELCECPSEYGATSCQNPRIGFYRWHKADYISSTIIIDLVGEARPCRCNDHSDVCDTETGVCLHCRDNTAGAYCESCAPGYYGHAISGICQPCACPSPQINHAESCASLDNDFICHCKVGYDGKHCERCQYGYFGNPLELNGRCEPCRCDKYGSVSDECDEITGQCNCRPGITGRDCSQCDPWHIITSQGCVSCDDECTGILLRNIQDLSALVDGLNKSGYVPAPWKELFVFENETILLEKSLQQYYLANATLLHETDLPVLAQLLQHRVKQTASVIHELEKGGKQLWDNATDLLNEAGQLFDRIREAIDYLSNYALGETPTINISRALKEAMSMLERLEELENLLTKDAALMELEESKKLLRKINSMELGQETFQALKALRNEILERIEDLNSHIQDANEETAKASHLTTQNAAKIKELQKLLWKITKLDKSIKGDINNITSINEFTRIILQNKDYSELQELMDSLDNYTNILEEREGILSNLNPEYRDKYVIPAQEHAAELERRANDLRAIFNKTREVADFPLRAATAYQTIVDALEGAYEAGINAKKAAGRAVERVYGNNTEPSLTDQAQGKKQDSTSLKGLVDDLHTRIGQSQEHLAETQGQLNILESQLQFGQDLLEDIKQNFSYVKILPPVGPSVQMTIDKIIAIDDAAASARQRAEEFLDSINSSLRPRLEWLKEGIALDTNHITKKIEDTEKNIRSSEQFIVKLQEKKDAVRILNNTLKLALDDLRNKIKRARHAASSVKISIADDSGECIRAYHSKVRPSTTTTISLIYAVQSSQRHALLLFLPSRQKKDFLALEMVDRRIRFTWSAGGTSITITHPLEILTSKPNSQDEKKWYKIEAERIGNIGRLLVKPIDLLDVSEIVDVTGASEPGFSKIDLDGNDVLWIGGKPPWSKQSLIKGFVGCLFEVIIDGNPVGLWNFLNTTSCLPCSGGAEEVKDESAYSFNGDGYTVLNRSRSTPYNPRGFSVSLSFRTHDENALLFLVVNEATRQLISLELRNGKVLFHVNYADDIWLTVESLEKYNTGNWTRVEATRAFQGRAGSGLEVGILKVGNQERRSAPNKPRPPLLDFEKALYYVGGVPPDFPRSTWDSVQFGSFLGCLQDIQVMQHGYNPLRGSFYGVEASCPENVIKTVSFSGNGYLELRSYPLDRNSSFGFSFQTKQSTALLLLSTFESTEVVDGLVEEEEYDVIDDRGKSGKEEEYYSTVLVDGKIEMRFSGNVTIMTNETYNDDKFHNLFLIKRGRKLELRMDDAIVGTARLLKKPPVIQAQDESGLYFGGLPAGLSGRGAAIITPFVGCIKDAVFDDRLLAMNKPVQFENASIGRCLASRLIRKSRDKQPDPSQRQSCEEVRPLTWEQRAVKLGDASHSHIRLPLRPKELQQNFNITFDFRTYYPDGLFLLALNKQRKRVHYMTVALKNGHLVMAIQGKKKKEAMSVGGLNNGHWCKVGIVKTGPRLQLRVDDNRPVKARVPKKVQLGNDLYVGGLPETGLDIPEPLAVKLDNLKGCIQGLVINGNAYDLAGEKNQVHKVGQCFARVEPGSYFGGDAYAIYSENFNVGALLDFELSFRTTELNGVLLSVSEPVGFPALSLEVADGAVVMAVDMGDQHPFRATHKFANKFNVCDNRWHVVKASYIRDSLTLRVDSFPQSYSFSGDGALLETHTNGPLYIGGLPDGAAQGTLSVRDNFKGCIRNIMLGRKRKDWTDMAHLHNVLLNSCPIV